jgi:hypothetical protein
MKASKLAENKRKNQTDVLAETLNMFPSAKVVCKLEERLAEVGLNLRELSLLTGIRYASLNDMKNGKRVSLSLHHVLAIMLVLKIKSFDELFELVIEDEKEAKRFDEEAEELYKHGVSDSILEKIRENAIKLGREDELRKR